MVVYLKHGPCDGERIEFTVYTEIVVIKANGNYHYYLITPRKKGDLLVFQYVGLAIPEQKVLSA